MGRICKDFTNEIHGCQKVLERDKAPKSSSHETFQICECQNCGNKSSVRKSQLDKNPMYCNNCKGESIRSQKIGDRYGLLTIIGKGTNINNHTYVKVQCDCGSNPFEVRLEHLKGQNRDGRTISCGCANISSGENKIKQILDENNIIYEREYRIKEFNVYSPFDFAIFDENKNLIKLIEYDGEQHFYPIEFFGGEGRFNQQQKNDKAKDEYCKKNNIFLQRISYIEYDNITLDMLLSVS